MNTSGHPGESAEIDVIVEVITANPGQLVAVEVPHREQVSELVTRLQSIYSYGFDINDGADVRLALGAAGSTLERALEHFATVMQLPYGAARTLWQFSEAVGERPSGYRSCVVVADAVDLLADEDDVIWRALADQLVGRPRCMGGGWDTLVFVDDRDSWTSSRFGSAANAERVAKTCLSSDEEEAMERELEMRYRVE
ncbi:hypothetical protein ACFVVM_03235 [Nocardia sp. NPDC058176]|uniref:hypothetical protein n=1 Tax=Nocardia sp. NPDC058176 TaxID=3346368 RepID=UPI0036DA894F